MMSVIRVLIGSERDVGVVGDAWLLGMPRQGMCRESDGEKVPALVVVFVGFRRFEIEG